MSSPSPRSIRINWVLESSFLDGWPSEEESHRFASFSVHVKCDVVKPRKPAVEARPVPPKQPQMVKASRSDPRFAAVKLGRAPRRFSFALDHFTDRSLVLPEHSTEVGDLIQPVPGVLYEDSKLKKGDPRRYQVNFRLVTIDVLRTFASV